MFIAYITTYSFDPFIPIGFYIFARIPLPYQKRKWLNQYYHHIIIIDIIRSSFQPLITEYSHFSNCNEFKIFAYVLVDISKLMHLFFLSVFDISYLIIYFLTNKCLRKILILFYWTAFVWQKLLQFIIISHIFYSMENGKIFFKPKSQRLLPFSLARCHLNEICLISFKCDERINISYINCQ